MSTVEFLDRVEASQTLKVSTRTIDRYIRRFRLKVRKDGRRVLIRRADMDKIIQDQIGHFSNLTVSNIKVEEVKKEGNVPSVRESIYEELYGEAKKDLKEKQERLEAATYRVGQLETQLKNMVPLLEFNRKEKALAEAQSEIDRRTREAETLLIKARREVRSERLAKWVYLSLVGLLLVAEPILLLFWAFS